MTEGARFAGRRKVASVKRSEGGTGFNVKSTEELATRLEVPTLDGDNTFTGVNSFEGQSAVEGLDVNGELAVYGGMTVSTDDPPTFTHAPTVGGDALITEAPQDGGYYVRRNGVWVDVTTELGL